MPRVKEIVIAKDYINAVGISTAGSEKWLIINKSGTLIFREDGDE